MEYVKSIVETCERNILVFHLFKDENQPKKVTSKVYTNNKKDTHLWAVRHSEKSPLKGIYSHQSALKILAIHKGFLRFLP